MDDPKLRKEEFGTQFKWGVSTAAFQIEGAHDADGKGLSVWDVFSAGKKKIKGGHNALTACDFYNTYKKDIGLVRDMNIPNFRFSLSWPRIMPSGKRPGNPAGRDYYNRVIDFLLECGIDPWVTLYHWDLPHALELEGGWTNRDIVFRFSEYAELCAKTYGDRVKNWIVMNEPSVFTGAGYFLGIHAPGKTGLKNYTRAIHNSTMATAAGGRALREHVRDANIGTTFSCTFIEPASDSEKDFNAAKRVDALLNRTFIEPLLGLGYPTADLPILRKLEKYMWHNDAKEMVFDFDFIGIQNYTREIVKSVFYVPYIGAQLVKAEKRNVAITDMKWEVYPEAMYHMLKKYNQYDGIRKIIITENGASFPDSIENGNVNDSKRLEYIQKNLEQLLRAKVEGCKVDGYFVWTLTDNFEWAEGYNQRFGLVHVDFETQKRIIKQSGLWYRDFLK